MNTHTITAATNPTTKENTTMQDYIPDNAMTVSATMSDPHYTEHGAIFPMVAITPYGDGEITLTIIGPDGNSVDACLTHDETASLRDCLTLLAGV